MYAARERMARMRVLEKSMVSADVGFRGGLMGLMD
jgi:hypothetical protein